MRISRETSRPSAPRMFFTSRFLPSRKPDRHPGIRSLLAVERRLDRAIEHAVDGEPVLQSRQRLLVHLAMHPHAVAPQPAGRRQFQHARQAAIIGQEQQALGVDVEASDRHQPRQIGRQDVENRLSAFRIAVCGHHAGRLVEQKQPRPLDRRDGGAVDLDRVVGHHVESRRCQLLAVDLDPAGGDQVFGVAPRGDAGTRQALGDALARRLGASLGRLAEGFLAAVIVALHAVRAFLTLMALDPEGAFFAVPTRCCIPAPEGTLAALKTFAGIFRTACEIALRALAALGPRHIRLALAALSARGIGFTPAVFAFDERFPVTVLAFDERLPVAIGPFHERLALTVARRALAERLWRTCGAALPPSPRGRSSRLKSRFGYPRPRQPRRHPACASR